MNKLTLTRVQPRASKLQRQTGATSLPVLALLGSKHQLRGNPVVTPSTVQPESSLYRLNRANKVRVIRNQMFNLISTPG